MNSVSENKKEFLMLNFYPGPSKIHEGYGAILSEMVCSGVASYNHRSFVFEENYRLSISILKQKLEVPDGYEICFLSSATECWESISQTFCDKKTLFYFNGAFGKKWARFGDKSIENTQTIEFDSQCAISLDSSNAELLCYVQNETSNGTQISLKQQKQIREKYSNTLIAVDATSSLGGTVLDLESCDIVFSSVQKCLGMPAGLAVVVLSPKAIAEIEERKSRFYNDLVNVWANHKKNQTTHTPNVLAILGIGRLFQGLETVSKYSKKTEERKLRLEGIIEKSEVFDFVIEKSSLRSQTVFCLTHSNPQKILAEAEKQKLILGKGYGAWKDNSIRIANFPAHSDADFDALIKFIQQCK